jgi:hypothetical protein
MDAKFKSKTHLPFMFFDFGPFSARLASKFEKSINKKCDVTKMF